jgi:hypothetical protein
MTDNYLLKDFEKEYPPVKELPKRILQMYNMYGRTEGKQCGECKYLCQRHFKNTYFKCEMTVISASSATDWRSRWEACGKFEQISGGE